MLFIDDAPEYPAGNLDPLRGLLDSGTITIVRAGNAVRYPAQFLLVLGARPCPCGEPSEQCTCPPGVRRRHLLRLPAPVLDRLDVRVHLDPVDQFTAGAGDPSAVILARVLAARERMAHRLRGTPWHVNGRVPAEELRRYLPLPVDVIAPAHAALHIGALTARGLGGVVRVAWTLADLDGATRPSAEHVHHALALRAVTSTT